MTYATGDLLELGSDFLTDKRFSLVLDQDDLERIWNDMSGGSINPPTGALVDCDETGEYRECWATWYSRPFDLASEYQKVTFES